MLTNLFIARIKIAGYGSHRQVQSDGYKFELTIFFITRNIITC